MPEYQFPIAVFLALCAAGSALVFVLQWKNDAAEGRIQLPVHYSADDELGPDEELDGEKDPFDVTTPEDISDGDPIDEPRFWKLARLAKMAVLLCICAVVVIKTIAFGWLLANDASSRIITTYILQIIFSLYVGIMAAYSIPLMSVGAHWKAVIHLCVLTGSAAITLGATALLPADASVVSAFAVQYTPLHHLWYSAFSLYAVAFLVAITIPRGPKLNYPLERIYSKKTLETLTSRYQDNVCGVTDASVWDFLFFSYTTKVVMLGNTSESMEIGDLPVVPGNMRATYQYSVMKAASKYIKLRGRWAPKDGSGWQLTWRLVRVNIVPFSVQASLAASTAVLYYAPAYLMQRLVRYLETDPERKDIGWGWVYCAGLFFINVFLHLMSGQLWSISTVNLQVRMKIQLNSMLYSKTLRRKDVASATSSTSKDDDDAKKPTSGEEEEKKDEEDEFSSKAQIMTLMTTDVDRVSDFCWHVFTLVDSPLELVIGTIFIYKLLGPSSLFGLLVTALFLPLNHIAGKVVVHAQENLMKSRDERVALMNEILGAIRMLKFMAWERSFEKRVMKIRLRELKYQRMNYLIEVAFNTIWNASPILVTLVSFWHFAVIRGETLTPSIAFTSIAVFSEMKFALNALPETFLGMLQSLVSLRRIEKYLGTKEVTPVMPLDGTMQPMFLQSASITWPQDRMKGSNGSSAASSAASTPRQKFLLVDLSLRFPQGELTLICGKLGSGKSLLLLALMGEADLLAGQLSFPRTPPDTIASLTGVTVDDSEWLIPGVCAYVPQTAWLRNASIKENILFNLPYVESRYQQTLEVCALLSDLKILEDGDDSEIGERGVNLSGGQKARVSLARAVYSRASVLLLDDVLSAVDAHTAHHLFHECLKGDLMRGRTVILVSHHVQLCAPGADYVVALENGRLLYDGPQQDFIGTAVMNTLIQSTSKTEVEEEEKDKEQTAEALVEDVIPAEDDSVSVGSSTAAAPSESDTKAAEKAEKKKPRQLVEEEKRAVGRISRDVWETYIKACGNIWYWLIFFVIIGVAALSPVVENKWLEIWSGSSQRHTSAEHTALFYISLYALITFIGLIVSSFRWFVLYYGSLQASTVLYQRLLKSVLFAHIRFHDTVSRGRLLNRFGKDFEGIDSNLSDNFGRSLIYFLSAITTIVTVSVVGGWPFLTAAILLGSVYWNVAKIYGQTSRDMRRLDSVTRSPLYSIYGETISGVTIIRSFGASSKFLRDMLRCVDTNINPYYWMWGVNRWLSVRFNVVSSAVVGVTAVVCLLNKNIDAALAGFALAFTSTVTNDLLFMVRRFVSLEQSMVALERVKEYSELPQEAEEFIEPRPSGTWPHDGSIEVEDLVIRYAPELPNVLHKLNFTVNPGEKVGVLGRTGSGKSTLALSFFRFVEATEGKITVDGIDISKIGLTDLRSRLTIIPQDPTIFSGTLRSTLDVFDEYEDAEIFEALRRVHLIPSADTAAEDPETVNANVFRNLDASVSEGGDNFSTGEKQLLCMARAILRRSKVLVMDEATASVDYATDELISKTIRQEFAESTILTIAHRLRTVIDYNRVMILEEGRIVEFDSPAALLADSSSRFHSLCKATGKEEFSMLKKLAGV